MNDFWLFIGSLVFVVLLAGVWCVAKTLFFHWLNNDWCRHQWGMWETKEENSVQMRFCKKCNMMERRVP
jgi:hypothetical protein